jgi:cytochrome c biogenesis protein CcmG/thiol:disulfide interchange protein DsbE
MTDLGTTDAAEPTDEESRPRTALVASLVIAVLVALLVVVLATRDSSNERSTQSPLLGKVAPTVAGTTLDGEEVSAADLRGRWCIPCREEHPQLLAFDAAHRAEGDAALIGVTFDEKADDARAFFEENGGTWPVIDDPENSIGVDFGVAQVPETFVIAPDGTVVQRYAGGVTKAALDELIASYEAAAES